MSNFFLPSYETSFTERLIFPLLSVYSYRHYQESCNPKISWQGRTVHFITAMVELIPILGAIVSVAEYVLFRHFQSGKAEALNPPNDPIEEPNAIDETIPVGEGEEMTPIDRNETLPPPDVQPEDDEEEILKALHLIEKTKGKDIITKTPDELEEELKLATLRILSISGIKCEPTPACNQPLYDFGVDAPEVLRGELVKEYPSAITPAELKKQRNVNMELYTALKLKRFGHAHSLKGYVPLHTGNYINCEGFSLLFTVPMLVASFKDWSKEKGYAADDADWICSMFNAVNQGDYMDPQNIEDLVQEIQDPDFVGPILFETGYETHTASVIFMGDYLIYCDRFATVVEPGVYVYHIDRNLITEQFISEITKVNGIKKDEYKLREKFTIELGANLIHYEKMPAQKSLNCTYSSMKTTGFVLMALRSLLNQVDKGEMTLGWLDGEFWAAALNGAKDDGKKWSAYDRELVFRDFMNEVKEWMRGNTELRNYELKETYTQALTAYIASKTGKNNPKIDEVREVLVELSTTDFQ